MKIWKNTSLFDNQSFSYNFVKEKSQADIILLGSQSIDLLDFHSARALYRAGIGTDNIPFEDAQKQDIKIVLPSKKTIKIIFEETASYTCSLIFKMTYQNLGSIDPWKRNARSAMSKKTLLVIGLGNIGSLVEKKMKHFLNVQTYDILNNSENELESLIRNSDIISIHIPKSNKNSSFFDSQKLSWMKDGSVLINTARGGIVSEDALHEEITKGRLKAAFDVFWDEPYNGKLKEFHPDSFYMSPHVSSTCSDFIFSCKTDLDLLIKNLND